MPPFEHSSCYTGITEGGRWKPSPVYKIRPDILDDLCGRFIVNLPADERNDFISLLFHIELAQWFYIDFYCTDKTLGCKECTFSEFVVNIFGNVSWLREHIYNVEHIVVQFNRYKKKIPVHGGILLNEQLTHVLLVQTYMSNGKWGFPKGKVNEDESPADCAVREVQEETGFDCSRLISEDFYEGSQASRFYIVPYVPNDTKFNPKVRGEIADIKWFALADLPTRKAASLNTTSTDSAEFTKICPIVSYARNWVKRQTHNTSKSG